MQKRDRPLCVRGRLEYRALVVGEHFEPRPDITGVIVSRLKFRRNAEIGAEEAAAELRDQFLARPFGPVVGVAAEVAVDPLRRRRPVDIMPISA